jgi:hypothetical protein
MELAVCAEMVFLELPVTERVRRSGSRPGPPVTAGWPWNASGPPSPPQRPDAARRLLAGRGPEVGHVDPDRVEHDPDP